MARRKEVQAEEPSLNCGTCKWLYVPYKGKTCYQGGAKPEDNACRAYEEKSDLDISLDEASSDDYVQSLNEAVTKPAYSIDVATTVKELKSYTVFWRELKREVVRPVPNRIENPKTLLVLIKHFEEVQAYQDRVLSLKMDLLRIKRRTDSLWLFAEAWLHKWPAAQTLKSDRQRQAYLTGVFDVLRRKMDNVDMLVKMCDIVGDNLSRAHFSLKEMREVATTYLNTIRQT